MKGKLFMKFKKQIGTLAVALSLMCAGIGYAGAAEAVNVKTPAGGVQNGTVKPPVVGVPKVKPTKEEMKARMEKRAAEFNKALELSDEQVAKAKEIRLDGHKKMKPLLDKKKAKLDEIRKVMNDDTMTVRAQDKKVQALRAELKEIDLDIRQMRRDNEKEFQSILTDEQKAKYAQIKEEGRRHFMEHRMPQGPENFHHMPPVRHHGFKPAPRWR